MPPQFLLATISAPHLPWPKPPRPRSLGHRAHRNVSHAPQREGRTSPEPSAHLGGSCAQQAGGSAVLPACTDAAALEARVGPCLHGARWFGTKRPRSRAPVHKSRRVAAGLRERATGTASQEPNNRPLRGVFGKVSRSVDGEEPVQVGGRQTQTDADVLTAAL